MVCLLMSIRPLTPNPTVLASSDRNPTVLMASDHFLINSYYIKRSMNIL